MAEAKVKTRSLAAWVATAIAIALLDQFTKHLIESALHAGESRPYTGFFNLVLAYNRGAAFSMLADASGWQRPFFIAVAIAAIVIVAWLLARHTGDRVFCLGLTLILGGAMGNL